MDLALSSESFYILVTFFSLQLYGGIQRYLEQFPDGGFFAGKNFVFDHRWNLWLHQHGILWNFRLDSIDGGISHDIYSLKFWTKQLFMNYENNLAHQVNFLKLLKSSNIPTGIGDCNFMGNWGNEWCCYLSWNIFNIQFCGYRISVGSSTEDILGTCLICANPFDDYSSRCRCKYCRMLVLVCDDCQVCIKKISCTQSYLACCSII